MKSIIITIILALAVSAAAQTRPLNAKNPTADSGELSWPAKLKFPANGWLELPTTAGDPGSPPNGAIWHNSSTGKIRVKSGGTTIDVGSGGGGSGVTTWANDAARAAAVPPANHQWGYQIDTGIWYQSTGTLAGNWTDDHFFMDLFTTNMSMVDGTVENTFQVDGTLFALDIDGGGADMNIHTVDTLRLDGNNAIVLEVGANSILQGTATNTQIYGANTLMMTVNGTTVTLAANKAIAFSGTGAATTRTNLGVGTGDSPTMTGLLLSGLTASSGVVTDGSKNLISLAYIGSGSLMRTRTGVIRTLYIPAAAMIPNTTNGAALGTVELATNKVMYDSMAFDQTTQEAVGFWVTLPSTWNAGTITFKAHWTAAAGSGTVQWDFAARCYIDDDAIDQAQGTAVNTGTDTLITLQDMHITSTTGACTVAGTATANRPIYVSVKRNVATDTLSGDALLLGATLEYTESATEPSAQ